MEVVVRTAATLVALVAFLLVVDRIEVSNGDPILINLSQQRGKYQGDITNRQLAKAQNVARNGVKLNSMKWPAARIPYEIRSSYSAKSINVIFNAMRRLEKSTCVRFVPRTNEADYISIRNTNDGCYSAVGRDGGVQDLSLEDNSESSCIEHSTVVHELLHAVGLDHEQSRYDRDQYVTVNYDNIEDGYTDQFQIFDASQSSLYGTPYDYNSVMHYTAYAYSKAPNLVTIMPKDNTKVNIIGNAQDASYYDLLKVNRMYNCGDSYGLDTNTTTNSCFDREPASTCNNYIRFCTTWSTLRTACARTCGTCTSPRSNEPLTTNNNCNDNIDSTICENYAKLNFCNTWSTLQTECRKTCNFC